MLSILNDTHLGFHRVSGTTVTSRETLSKSLWDSFYNCLKGIDTDLLIAGDLFDKFTVSNKDLILAVTCLSAWLQANPENTLILQAGNHDWSDRGTELSTFETLYTLLRMSHGERVVQVAPNSYKKLVIDPDDEFSGYSEMVVYAVAHHSDQTAFVATLDKVAEDIASTKGMTDFRVVLHANYSNKFAARSDHSLNVSEEMADKLAPAQLIFAHEHQQKRAKGGRVVVIGNQWPTSVSDCQGNDTKRYARLECGGIVNFVDTWSASDPQTGYVTVDWRQLGSWTEYPGFIEIVGEASSDESAEVMGAVAKFRAKSKCMVMTQSVEIAGIVRDEGDLSDLRVGKKFDVRAFAATVLKEQQMKTFDALSGE